MAAKRAFPKAKSDNVFGQARKPAKMIRAGLDAGVSTNDQQTLAMQNRAMREYAARRGLPIALQGREVNSAAAWQESREKVLEGTRRREMDLGLAGPLGPIRNRSAGDTPGAGASGCRFLFLLTEALDRDHPSRELHGRPVGHLRRV